MAATDDLWDRLAEDVQTQIIGLNLQGVALAGNSVGSNVYVQTLPDESNVQYPCVMVTWEGATEEEEATYETDEILYPINVWVADRYSFRQDGPPPRKDYLAWRRLIARLFRTVCDHPNGTANPIMPQCPEVWDCEIRPAQVFDPKLPHYQYIVSGLVLRFRTTELRQGRG